MRARLAARTLTLGTTDANRRRVTSRLGCCSLSTNTTTTKSPRRIANNAIATDEDMTTKPTGPCEKLAALREELAKRNLAAFIVPSQDPHFSEYVAACFARRGWISNFTGSAGTVVVTAKEALLWTDGRYFVQAEDELTEEWTLMRSGTKDVPDVKKWLKTLESGSVVGIDPNVHSVSEARALRAALSEVGSSLTSVSENLVDAVWKERPAFPKTPLRVHDIKYAGKTVADKLTDIRKTMGDNGVQYLVVSSLDDVMWLCNVRGGDAPCNPVTLSYVLVGENDATFYVDVDKVTPEVKAHLDEAGVAIKPYEEMSVDVRTAASQGNKLWMDVDHVSIAMLEEAEAGAVEAPKNAKAARADDAADASAASKVEESKAVKEGTCPIPIAKAVKNEAEMAGMVEAHLMDGAAMAEFWCWIEKEIAAGRAIDEYEAGDKVLEFRAKQNGFIEESFPTIAGEGPHGAVVHYRASKESARAIGKESLLLCDSGGQYACGTTDVTRTVHFGTPTDHQKECYTRVLQGHIALDQMVFPVGTKGFVLDAFARSHLWANGLDYRHGTGHGVGAALNVHEGPQGISPRFGNMTPLMPGMILSNEPGYYEDGAFGIRIETLLRVVEAQTKFNFGDTGYLSFDVLTLIPIQKKLMDTSIMSVKEIDWVNAYHEKVWKNISPRVSGDTLAWLEDACKPIAK
jgi:Xaa-Pro aminopeptidase